MSKWAKDYAVVYACELTYVHRKETVKAEGLLEAMVLALDGKRSNEVVSTVKQVQK
jgi:hypothetical protein